MKALQVCLIAKVRDVAKIHAQREAQDFESGKADCQTKLTILRSLSLLVFFFFGCQPENFDFAYRLGDL